MDPHGDWPMTPEEETERNYQQALDAVKAQFASANGLLAAVTEERDRLMATLTDFRETLADESDVGWHGEPNMAMRLATRLEHSHARASKALDDYARLEREVRDYRAERDELRALAESAMRAPTNTEQLLAASVLCARLVRGK